MTIAISNIATARYKQTIYIYIKKQVATLEDNSHHFFSDNWACVGKVDIYQFCSKLSMCLLKIYLRKAFLNRLEYCTYIIMLDAQFDYI
jgi:hypothetical protein